MKQFKLGNNKNVFTRTRQIIRCRVTATLWRPQIKQYTYSNEKGGGVQSQHHIILTTYQAVYTDTMN